MSDTERKQKLKKIGVWTLWGVWVCFALGVGTAWGFMNKSPLIKETVLEAIRPSDPKDLFGSDELTLLILGTDEDRRSDTGSVTSSTARSDVVMVTKLQFDKNRITGITIPRDTLAKVDGHSIRRINAFHAIGGKDLAEEAVEALLNIEIDRVVVVNYEVFQEMVDMLGGVNVDVQKSMKYDDERGELHIDLAPGKQKLNGYKAMGYVRYRVDGDFNRQKRQREFMLLLKDQALSQWTRIPELADMTSDLTGNVFRKKELAFLFNWSREVKGPNIKMGMLPVLDAENFDLIVDKNKLKDTLIEYELIEL